MPWYAGPIPDPQVTERLRFVRLTEELVDADLAAVMASREYLRRWSDSPWPEDDFTRADNEEDLRHHRLEHEDGVAFTYSVLASDVDEGRVVGCIYIRPLVDALETRDVDVSTIAVLTAAARIAPDAAVVRGWIRSDEPAGLLDVLVATSIGWLAGDAWGFPDVWWMASESARRIRPAEPMAKSSRVKWVMASAALMPCPSSPTSQPSAPRYSISLEAFDLLPHLSFRRWISRRLREPSGSQPGSRKQLRPRSVWARVTKTSLWGTEKNHLWPSIR